MSLLSAILIPSLSYNPLEEINITFEDGDDDDNVLTSIQQKLVSLEQHNDDDPENVIPTLLIRPSDISPGLFAYHNPTNKRENRPNIRATRLAMACGLFSMRFYGSVIIVQRSQAQVIESLTSAQIEMACCGSPDLRSSILASLGIRNQSVPRWLLQAAQSNYHDQAAVQKLAAVMENSAEKDEGEVDSGDEREESNSLQHVSESNKREAQEFVTTVPLCLHCRRPANVLCSGCHGVYSCGESCRQQG